MPAIIAGAAAWLGFLQQNRQMRETQADREIAQAARENKQQIAKDQQAQNMLEICYAHMSTLLLDYDLDSANDPNDTAHGIARARTLTVLENLNDNRQGNISRGQSKPIKFA